LTKTRMSDPFIGTGTTFLEAAKDDRLVVVAGDINPAVLQVVADNIEFFVLTPAQIDEVVGVLHSIESILSQNGDAGELGDTLELFPGPMSTYGWAKHLLDSIRPPIPTVERSLPIPIDALRLLAAEPLASRIVFYVCLRAWIRS